MEENFQILEKILRAMEGDEVFGGDDREMCLVSGLMILVKFNTLFLIYFLFNLLIYASFVFTVDSLFLCLSVLLLLFIKLTLIPSIMFI